MAKTIDGVIGVIGSKATNYIQQINDGTNLHDIAVKSGITFFNGQSDDTDGVTWDGTQALQVVIPSVTDIITDPVRLVGTVNAQGEGAPQNPKNGDLVFIAADCTFAGQVCEAGDMAVYTSSDSSWHVISGENQVTLAGTTDASTGHHSALIGGTPVNVINVEGKNLSLAIDYADVRSKVSVSRNPAASINVAGGSITVAPTYIGLSKAEDTTRDITESVSISLPTALADGAVTISDKVLAKGDFTFTSGAYPTIVKNSASIEVNASHNLGIAVGDATGDFVTGVEAIGSITFGDGNSASNDFSFVSGLSVSNGTAFVSGIRTKTVEDSNADFTVWGQATVATSTFVNGLSEASTSGDLVSSISIGNVGLNAEGSGILTGLSDGGNAVVTSVNLGTLVKDTEKDWFVSGLTTGTDVVTGVDFGSVVFTANNDIDQSLKGDAIVSASVSNHILSFTTGTFMKPVSASLSGTSVSKSGLAKAGATISGASVSSDTFTTASIAQPTVSISYRDLATGNVTLSQDSTDYVFNKESEHVYSAQTGYVKATVTSATVTKNNAVITNPTITAYISASQVAVDVTAGTLPTLAIADPSATISGTVGTSLTTSNKTWLAVASDKKDIPVAGAYTLGVVASDASGAVAVADASTYNLNNGKVTIAADSFITNVFVDGSSVISA